MCGISIVSSARWASSDTIGKESLIALKDCDTVVASKFFPIDGPEGKQVPLCERDYFRRLNLICSKCNQALRGSYITACSALYSLVFTSHSLTSPDKKYHVEHFTCSVCPTVFGPQDSLRK